MKKVFCLTAVVIVFMLFLFGCQKSTDLLEPQSVDENDMSNLSKKPEGPPGKPPKPETEEPRIEYLRIYDSSAPNGYWSLIEGNERIGNLEHPDILLDLGNTESYEIKYKVSHSIGISNVEIMTWCDILHNGYSWPMDGLLDFSGDIHEKDFSPDDLTEGSFFWNGEIIPSRYDREVYPYEYENREPYLPFDQYATTDAAHRDGIADSPDYYGFMFVVESTGDSPTARFQKTATFRVKSNYSPDITFHVKNVEKSSKSAFITVVKDDGSPLLGAWVYGYWDSSSLYYKAQTNEDGIAEIKKGRGGKIFSVKSVKHTSGVYNPWENEIGNWSDNLDDIVEPHN